LDGILFILPRLNRLEQASDLLPRQNGSEISACRRIF
jgi:hypothetical protein